MKIKLTKYMVFTCLLFARLNSFGCTDNLNNYYYYVHKAEHMLLNKFYNQSLESYDSSFKYKIHPFTSDINNALFCCLAVKNYEKALVYCIQLAQKGATLKYFSQSAFSGFNKSPYGRDLRNRFGQARVYYESKINQPIRNEILKLVEADQQIHCQLPGKSGDTAFVSEMHGSDQTIYRKLEELFTLYDYLNEEVIGANFVSDTIVSVTPLYGPIAVHNVQRTGVAVMNKLQEAVNMEK